MSETTYIYVPVQGSRVSKEEAAIIGSTIAALRERYPDGFTTQDFLKTIRNPRHPAYQVFARHRKRMAKNLDAEVAKYLRISVDVIVVEVEHGVERRSEPMPVTRVYSFITDQGGDTERESKTFLSVDVKSNAELLDMEEQAFRTKVERLVRDFVNLCGGDFSRARAACVAVFGEFELPQSRADDRGVTPVEERVSL